MKTTTSPETCEHPLECVFTENRKSLMATDLFPVAFEENKCGYETGSRQTFRNVCGGNAAEVSSLIGSPWTPLLFFWCFCFNKLDFLCLFKASISRGLLDDPSVVARLTAKHHGRRGSSLLE